MMMVGIIEIYEEVEFLYVFVMVEYSSEKFFKVIVDMRWMLRGKMGLVRS